MVPEGQRPLLNILDVRLGHLVWLPLDSFKRSIYALLECDFEIAAGFWWLMLMARMNIWKLKVRKWVNGIELLFYLVVTVE